MSSPLGYIGEFDGYQCLVFLHERRHFSVVLVRPTADAALSALRVGTAYEAACSAIPVLDEGTDPLTVAHPFDTWCEANIEPWVADHVAIDGGMVKRWQGDDIDLSGPLTSNLIADALQVEPRIGPYAGDYFAMTGLPATLRPAEPLARAAYQSGWRPPFAPGPSRNKLVEIIERSTAGLPSR